VFARRATRPTNQKSVKQTDRPDSVQRGLLRNLAVTAIPLGRESPHRLGATYPPAPRVTSTLAYLVLLRAEIARFTLRGASPAESGWPFWCSRTPDRFRGLRGFRRESPEHPSQGQPRADSSLLL
jgi:hypothetical protein